MEENNKTTPDQNTEKDASDTAPVKKKKRNRKKPEENKTKIHPEQYEEFINEVPEEQKTDEANEVKSNDTDQNEVKP